MNQDYWIKYRIESEKKSSCKKKDFKDMNRRESRKYIRLISGRVALVAISTIALILSWIS